MLRVVTSTKISEKSLVAKLLNYLVVRLSERSGEPACGGDNYQL